MAEVFRKLRGSQSITPTYLRMANYYYVQKGIMDLSLQYPHEAITAVMALVFAPSTSGGNPKDLGSWSTWETPPKATKSWQRCL